MKDVNSYRGDHDAAILNAAIRDHAGGTAVIGKRRQDTDPARDFWLIDEAIILPANTTVILDNCTIKLSDRCRDNFFRSENCWLGVEEIAPISGIHLKGIGQALLLGADHPRATGDSSKQLKYPCPKKPEDICRLSHWVPEERRKSGKLDFWDIHSYSYGTDCGKDGESQLGDWRNIGILLANADHFSIENIKIKEPHGWAISLEACHHGRITGIEFDACMAKEIDGLLCNMENEDGIDLRNGCHDILIEDITGGTGDDVIAMTAIASPTAPPRQNGSFGNTQIMHNDWTRRDTDIHDIIIRNVRAYSKGGICYHVRFLPVGSRIYNVVIDGLIDTSPDDVMAGGVILLGEFDGGYGTIHPHGAENITISNVICNSSRAILIYGYLNNSVIQNVINKNPNCPVIDVRREHGMNNVLTNNLLSASGEIIRER